MKTTFKTLAAITMALGLFSCSNDDVSGDPVPHEPGAGLIGNAETYATFRISMPNDNATVRTDPETGDGVEVGTGNENAFKSVSLYFFDANACLGVLEINSGEFTKKSDGEVAENMVVYESKPQKIGIEGTDIPVYAVVNGSVSDVNAGTSLADFLAKTVDVGKAIDGTAASLNHLLMTSRVPGNLTISAKDNGNEQTPAALSVSVERTAAKISYKANNNNTFTILDKSNTQVGSVTVTHYKLINLRNDAYYFRKVGDGNGTIGENNGSGNQTASNYVIDPKFKEKTLAEAEKDGFETTWFGDGKAYASNSSAYAALPAASSNTVLAYCMENTMPQASQLNGYSTGIVFQATYVPETLWVWDSTANDWKSEQYVAGTDFYRYADVLYKTKQEILDHYGSGVEKLIDTYTGDTKSGATCYYHYWIRHMNNNNPDVMGIMEFAIVRNNAYNLDIAGVTGIGEPTDETDPDNPDETGKMYLKVNVTILPWVVRDNSIIL